MFGSRKTKEPMGPIASGADVPKLAKGADVAQLVGTRAAAEQYAEKNREAASNGGKAPAAADRSTSDEAHRRGAIAIRQSLAFAQIISVLMRSPHYKHYTLADLEWLVLPPLVTGQFSVAEAGPKEGGPRIPVAVVLWASVSVEVDKRLSENLSGPIRLRPDEWKSGDTLWLVDAIGDGRIVGPLMKQLGEGLWKGRDVKLRIAGDAGKPLVKRLSEIQTVTADKPT